MDSVYRERAHLVAYLAAAYPSAMKVDFAEPDWPVVYIQTPRGQLSWHVARDDLPLFAHVPWDHDDKWTWDNHTTEEKYARLDALTTELTQKARGSA